jgi:putative hemolysin
MNIGLELAVILGLTLVNGFFSAAEISILSVRRSRLQELADARKAAAFALRLRENPEHFLATVQVGITLVGSTASAFGGATLAAPLAHWLGSLGVTRGADQLALALVVMLISVLSIVLGELVPKSLAIRNSERISLAVARPLALLSRLAKPLVWLLTALSNLMLRPFRDQTNFTEARLSPQELQTLVEEAATAGSLAPTVGDIASRAIELGQLTVSSLLVPRTATVFIRLNATRDEIWATLKKEPHSRYPVVQSDLDSIEGYLVTNELIIQLVEQTDLNLRSLMREVLLFVEPTPAVTALRELQTKQAKLGVVVDEHGMTSGIVTITDIAEALLGEVLNEHERPDDSIRFEADRVALVRADTPLQEVNRRLGTELPGSPDYATLSGLLMHESSRILKTGERLSIDGVQFEVVAATPRQVKMVRVRLPSRATEPSTM